MAGAVIGSAAGQWPGDAAIYHAADLITVGLLAALRAGTLLLGGIELSGGAKWSHPAAAGWLLAGLTCLSALTFARAGHRVVAGTTRRPLDAATVVTEVVTGVAALFILSYATTAGARASSSFWVEPYTVISAVIIAASVRRAWSGALTVACLTGAYLLSVLPGLAPGSAVTGQANVTAAWTNSMSFLAFYALAGMGFRLLRSITGQAETLRQMIAQLSAERARVVAAGRIYQIGHDIPKALLREVRRGTMPPERLRAWAPRFRADLLAEVAADPREQVELRQELARVTAAYAAGMQLEVDLDAMVGQPSGMPALLMAEAVRELLNNASYHRYGYPVQVFGSASAERVEVCVHNGGPGVEPRRLASAWALKQNTIHQFEAAGGGYRIHSAPPPARGTTVILSYPGEER
jgi:hypothetical protein